MTGADQPHIVHVEHVFNRVGEGVVVSLPIVVTDSRMLLRVLLDGLGSDNRAPIEWNLWGRHDPFSAWQEILFNGAKGWRLRVQLRALVAKRWRWRKAVRAREFGLVSGSAGRAYIPIERMWMAQFPDMPGPMQFEWLRDWGDRKGFGLFNDGLIAIDISRVRGIDIGDEMLIRSLVATLLASPLFWSHAGIGDGRFDVRVRGHVSDLLDDRNELHMKWRPRRRRLQIADVFCTSAAKPEATA